MKTPLDEQRTDQRSVWFLEGAVYDGTLTLHLAEAVESETPDEWLVGDALVETLPLELTAESRLYDLHFDELAAWQAADAEIVGEREGEGDVVEVHDDSPYLRFIRETCGWFSEAEGEMRHYRIWTLEEVVDVISAAPPSVVLAEAPPAQ